MRTVKDAYAEMESRFERGLFREVSRRKELLSSLAASLTRHEADIFSALASDLAKTPYETDMTETAILHAEIRLALRNAEKWAKPKRPFASLMQFPAKCTVYAEPLGKLLIISPWNYPILLTLSPLVGAIAAGNSAVVKPSELAPASAEVIRVILEESGAAVPVLGGADTARELIALRWDHIFFTGGARVGKSVLEAAARHFTPVTLELGGKSPVICDKSADIKTAAKRIAWGKLLNAGQTCVAPDYLFAHFSVYDALISELKSAFDAMFSWSGSSRIVNSAHFERLLSYLKDEEIIYGGSLDADMLKISPALIRSPGHNSPIMTEEIFGPLLPVFAYEDLSEPLNFIKSRPSPLALYLFSKDKKIMARVNEEISFGGGCINDTIIHIANIRTPFGGVGESGNGAYHGREGFERFSRRKTVAERSLNIDMPIRFPPFGERSHALFRFFRRWL